MAKKKKEVAVEEVSKDKSIQALIKKFGEDVFQSADYVLSRKDIIIPFAPKLDMILGGGIQFGSVVRMTGKEGGGKTLSALHLAKKAQQMDKDVYVVYINVEGRLKARDLNGIEGLDTSPNRFINISSHEGKILSSESFLEIAEWYIRNQPKAFIIIDSVSQLVSQDELNAKLGERNYGGLLMSQFCKRNSNPINVNNIILVAITHQIANMGKTNGPSKSESGGSKIKYATDVGLEIRYIEDWCTNNNDKSTKIGQIVHWKTNKTALNIGPGFECTSYIRYGTGIDEKMEIFELACSAGFINQAGSWYQLRYLENHIDLLEDVEEWNDSLCKFQGAEKTLNALKENPSWYAALEKEVREMFFSNK